MKRSVEHAADVEELRGRLQSLTAEDRPRWGKMNVGEMVCHLREAYGYALKTGEVVMLPGKLPPKVTKYFALRVLKTWPPNEPTLPEFRVGAAGMRPGEFAADRAGLLQAFERFCAGENYTRRHPIFGAMRHWDWMRWGYLHADHHLRQFGR